jgi:UDP-N-acetylglucosamine--dolichyl-phosphate N-acetylglucosaminephosphotransferase
MDLLTGMTFSALDVLYFAIIIVVPLLIVFVLMPWWMKFARRHNWIGNDIHKVDRPEVPESGGAVPAIALVVGIILIGIFYAQFIDDVWTLLTCVIIASIIGFIDDRKQLSPLLKIISVIFAGLPFLVSNFLGYITLGYPMIPVIGLLQLTFVYPLATPIIIAVTTNSVNMLEGYNGEAGGTCLIIGVAMLLGGIIMNSAVAVIFILPFIAVCAGFLYFNKYPARVFPGDIGTLMMGAMIGGVMILGGIEVATFCALLAHIFNAFYVIVSLRGLRESHTVKIKDIILLEDNRIQASVKEGAPVTLPRLLLAFGELNEPQLVTQFWKLTLMAGLFSIVAAVATAWTANVSAVNSSALLGVYIGIWVACGVIFGILFWKNPRLRGIATIMIILLLVGLGIIIFFGLVVFPFSFAEGGLMKYVIQFGFVVLVGGPGLLLWYLIQNRYFWRNIERYKSMFSQSSSD